MNENKAWTEWEGQVADKTYRLERFLGSTDHSVVFQTEIARPGSRKAAIKLIPANFPEPEKQLDAWAAAAQLSHPNLLQLYAEGRCRLEGMELLYVVMEYAEENLGQFLPQRAMTAEETRQVLDGATDVLVFLHDKRLTHGHLKPSNVLSAGDQLKFSSDTILPAGEVRGLHRERDAYDAPETASSPMSTAGDVWSLGATIVEALTQQAPALPFDEKADLPIPVTLGEPFLEIARHTLRREAKWRWTSSQIAARLSPSAAAPRAAAASAGAATKVAVPAAPPPPPAPAPKTVAKPPAPPALSVPLSKEPAVPLAKLPTPETVSVSKPALEGQRPSGRTLVLPNYVVPLLAGVLALTAILVLPRILRRHMETSLASIATSSKNSAAKAAAGAPKPREKAVQADAPAAAKPATSDSGKTAGTGKSGGAANAAPFSAAATPAPAVLRSESREATRPTRASASRGEVLEQVLPKTSEKALATISGTVRVGVRAHVDAAGNVVDVELDTPGPSRYFAEQALEASRHWLFNTPEVDGRSVASDWLIRFEFRSSGVKASANQSKP